MPDDIPLPSTPLADASSIDAGQPSDSPLIPPPVSPEEFDLSTASEGLPPASMDQSTIDELLSRANFEDPSAMEGAEPEDAGTEFKLPDFQQVMQDAQVSSIDLLRDVDLNVKIELGRSRMLVEDVLKLGEGSVVELDKLAGDPVDVFVNDRLVARGEVLVLNDNFCVRINEIVAGVKDEGN